MIQLKGVEVKKVEEIKYGSMIQSNGACGKEVKKCVQAGGNESIKVLGVICDKKVSAKKRKGAQDSSETRGACFCGQYK